MGVSMKAIKANVYLTSICFAQFKWHLRKKAARVIYLQFALQKHALIEQLHDKQEQIKEWLHNWVGEDRKTIRN
ncbi:hypothetical protein AHAS_Ahas19G0298600 [Arachis hypogaea]